MMQLVEIRLIPESERAELFEIVQRYWAELMPHSSVVKNPMIQPRYFEYQFKFGIPGSYQWWAILDSVKIGFANLLLIRDWTEKAWAEIHDFYMEPQWRRQGYGRAFFQALVNWMETQRVYRIDLLVRVDSPAARVFWKNVGFDLTSYRMRRYLESEE